MTLNYGEVTFLENKDYKKQSIYDFAKGNISSIQYSNYIKRHISLELIILSYVKHYFSLYKYGQYNWSMLT